MQSEDNRRIPDRPCFREYRDPKIRSRKNHKVSRILKSDAIVNIRKIRKAAYSRYKSKLKKVPYCDIPYSPRAKRTVSSCDTSVSCHFKFKKREITTIQEEVIHYKPSKSYSSLKEKKDYKDKVASLKSVVKRLKYMCVAKPEVMQNKLPEDIMLLFSGIQLQ